MATAISAVDVFRNWAVTIRRSRRLRLVLSGIVVAGGARPVAAQETGLLIRQLNFVGNRSIRSLALEAAISTTKSSYFVRSGMLRWLGLGEKRYLNEREFRTDAARLRLFYQLSGFLDVQVDTAVVRTATEAYITFRIAEGEPVRVRTFTVSGIDSLSARDRLVEYLPLRDGAPYNRYLLVASADTIQTRLWDRGYPTASVLVGKRAVDRAARTADLELFADPGMPATIGSIRIVGTKAVDSSFVRTLLATRPGRPFRSTDLYRSQLNLYQSGLFRFATVGNDTTLFTVGDPTVPLLVEVQEGPLYRVRSGLGVGTNDCVRASAGWTAKNVGGRGRQLDFAGGVSKIGVLTSPLRSTICNGLENDTLGSRQLNYSVSASLRRPVFLSPSNALTGTIFAERRSEFLVYQREEIGTAVNFSHDGGRGLPVSLTYRLGYGSTQASAVSFCAFFLACRSDDVKQLRERRFVATLTGTATRQRVNNLLDPTRGTVISFETTFSSPLIGSTRFSEFTRLVAEGSWYRTLGNDVVLAARVKGGLIFSPRLQLASGAANFVPPDQRFYAGGANDVRGYDRNELGPVVYVTPASNVGPGGTVTFADSVQVAPIGGNTLALGNLELRLPSPFLRSQLRWVAFLDAGGVWERGSSLGAGIRLTPGVGIRFATALGPIRFDVAYNASQLPEGALYSAKDDELILVRNDYRKRVNRKFNFQVSVGQAF